MRVVRAGWRTILFSLFLSTCWIAEGNALPAAETPPTNRSAPLIAVADNAAPTALVLINTTGDALVVVAVESDGSERPVGELGPGRRRNFRVKAGATLKFMRGGEAVGDPFPVQADGPSELSLPYHAAEKHSPPHDEKAAKPGEVPVRFTNSLSKAVTVAVEDAAGATALYDIAPGQTETRHAKLNSKLGFYPIDADDPVGDAYVVTGKDDKVTIPFVDPAKSNKTANAPPHEDKAAKPGDVPVRFTNSLAKAVTVAVEEREGKVTALYDIAPGTTEARPAKPNAKLFFYPIEAEDAVGDAYVVTGKDDKVTIPFVDPAKSNKTANAPPQEDKTAKPGDVPVGFTNSMSKAVTVAVEVAAGNVTALYDIAPGKTEARPARPSAKLFFYPSDADTPIGDAYVVTGKDDKVTIPYADPSKKKVTAEELIASGKIDLKAIAAEVSRSIIASQMDAKKARMCWRDTYGRGVGTVPRICPAGQSEDTAGLCYNNCRRGYKAAVTMCVPECPAGFRDDGLYCFKPAPITRDSYPWKFGDGLSMNDALARCRKAHGRDCVVANANTMVYSTCPPGYQQAPVVTNLCTPVCPPNTTDIGISCQKNTYDRGVGGLMSCAANQQQDAGLCYSRCNAGFSGVGPVCWAACPASLPVNCGASCAKDKDECALAVTDQVTTPIMVAANVALIALTAGAGAGATAGANTLKAGAKTAGKTAADITAKATAKESARAILKSKVKQAFKSLATKASQPGVRAFAADQAIDVAVSAAVTGAYTIGMSEQAKADLRASLKKEVAAQLANQISDEQIDSVVNMAIEGAGGGGVDFDWASLDPTGIAAVVQAYNFPICSKVK